MTRSSWLAAALIAGLFLAFHLPFLPPTLEDLDSINFALGVRDFDIARHQPHPPGYPLFILAAKAVHAVGPSEARALSLVSVCGGAVAVFGCLWLFRALDRRRVPGQPFALLASLLVVTCPLFWLTAARPLSDTAGLAAALAVQALTISVSSTTGLTCAAAAAGLAGGVRSQVVWLTLPLVLLTVARLPRGDRARGLAGSVFGYGIGALSWFVPLVVVSGGPRAYWSAFMNQGAEDLSGVAMLATTHTLRLTIETLRAAFLAPWSWWPLGTAVLALAVFGLIRMASRAPAPLATLSVAFGPYLAFDLLFQEAITTRYALPLVVPVVYLAACGATWLARVPGVALMLSLTLASLVVDDQALYGYSSMDAPAFRMLGDMKAASSGAPPVLAMHRKGEFDMRRPIHWMGNAMPALAGHLPAPPKHEWLGLVKYWNGGGRGAVWFVADPLRSDLALIRYPGRPSLYRWPFAQTALVGGARPNEMDWHVIEAPDWYLGEGWALTPETAGVAREDRRGPGYGPISGWIRRWPVPVVLLIGGRNLLPGGAAARIRVALDGVPVDEWTVAPGFFLRILDPRPLTGSGEYAHVTIEADSQDVAIEQFDAQPVGRVMFGYGDGWNEQEHNPATGTLWRWSSDRAALRVRAEGRALALSLRGEVEAASTSHVVVRVGDAVVSAFDVGRSFSRTVIIPAPLLSGAEGVVTIESSAWSVPAEKRWRSRDQRRLGLKLFECRVTPAS